MARRTEGATESAVGVIALPAGSVFNGDLPTSSTNTWVLLVEKDRIVRELLEVALARADRHLIAVSTDERSAASSK